VTVDLAIALVAALGLVAAPGDTPAPPKPALVDLLPAMDGWKVSDAPARYTPENLFEYIDGAADLFLRFDFDELATATYENAEKVSVTVDIYRHRDALGAFGVYSQERPAGSAPLGLGADAWAGPEGSLQMVAGPYYVKLVQLGGRGRPLARVFAEKVAARVAGGSELPAVLGCFPEKGKRPRAEKVAMKGFLGHAFLHAGFTAPYEIDGARFRLFAIQGSDAKDVGEMVRRWLALAKVVPARADGASGTASGAPAERSDTAEGGATVKDPLNGEVLLRWKGGWIWGAVDDSSRSRKPLADELGRSLLALPR
jgi:hypothetical protein